MINWTVARITLRALLGRRRFLLLLPLLALMVVLAAIASGFGAAPRDWVPAVVVGMGFAGVLPVMALIVGASVLGSEIDDGTAVHLLTKPLPRREIVLTKLLVASLVTVVTVGAAMAATALLAAGEQPRLLPGMLAGTAVGAVAYCTLFLTLSLLTRRPVLIGLAYVLVWESLLANLVEGTAVLSIQQYSLATTVAVSGTDLFGSRVSTPVSLAMAAIVTVGAAALAVDRLRSFSVAGETS